MFLGVKAFLESPLGRKVFEVVLVVAMIAGVLGEIYHAGSKHQAAKYEAAQTVAKADIKTHEATAGAITVKAATGLSEARRATAARFVPLIKRIPYDVPPEADVDCRPGPGFVSLWNSGAAGVDPGVSGIAR